MTKTSDAGATVTDRPDRHLHDQGDRAGHQRRPSLNPSITDDLSAVLDDATYKVMRRPSAVRNGHGDRQYA